MMSSDVPLCVRRGSDDTRNEGRFVATEKFGTSLQLCCALHELRVD
jgi:hypothetical protein